jgi:hypothetical protein
VPDLRNKKMGLILVTRDQTHDLQDGFKGTDPFSYRLDLITTGSHILYGGKDKVFTDETEPGGSGNRSASC